jgi:hypothetical protein
VDPDFISVAVNLISVISFPWYHFRDIISVILSPWISILTDSDGNSSKKKRKTNTYLVWIFYADSYRKDTQHLFSVITLHSIRTTIVNCDLFSLSLSVLVRTVKTNYSNPHINANRWTHTLTLDLSLTFAYIQNRTHTNKQHKRTHTWTEIVTPTHAHSDAHIQTRTQIQTRPHYNIQTRSNPHAFTHTI